MNNDNIILVEKEEYTDLLSAKLQLENVRKILKAEKYNPKESLEVLLGFETEGSEE